MPGPHPTLGHACPHVDRNDPRCQARFSMAELGDMYRYCVGGFHGCALFHRINREDTYRQRTTPAVPQQVTVHGRRGSPSRSP